MTITNKKRDLVFNLHITKDRVATKKLEPARFPGHLFPTEHKMKYSADIEMMNGKTYHVETVTTIVVKDITND